MLKEIRSSKSEIRNNFQKIEGSKGPLGLNFELLDTLGICFEIRYSDFEFARARSAPRGLFALIRLRRGGFDPENGFAVLHQIEPVARDRFQINGIGLEEIHFARLFGEQHLLLVALGLESVDLLVAEF
jgi:hypothetical protein